jgi:hypothetical protein
MGYNKDKIDEMMLALPNHRSSCPFIRKFLAEMAIFSIMSRQKSQKQI